MSLKEGLDKNYDAIPLEIMEKLRKGKKLTSIEVDLIEALECLKKEIKCNKIIECSGCI